MRVVEPFVKGNLVLLLISRGAEHVTVTVDGAEPEPGSIREVLNKAGDSRDPLKGSRASWTGRYQNEAGAHVVVISRPGIDVDAMLPDHGRFVAECKGEPTEKAVQAGRDRMAFCTGLGQLILSAGTLTPIPTVKCLAVPSTERIKTFARGASSNPYIQMLGISLVTVDEAGRVEEL